MRQIKITVKCNFTDIQIATEGAGEEEREEKGKEMKKGKKKRNIKS